MIEKFQIKYIFDPRCHDHDQYDAVSGEKFAINNEGTCLRQTINKDIKSKFGNDISNKLKPLLKQFIDML